MSKMLLPRLDNCPHCGYELNGDLIATKLGEQVAIECYGGADKRWRNEIGVEVAGVYDGDLYFKCPKCKGKWHRWAPGSGFHERAIPFVEA